jgi:hypothetical protein
VREAKELDLSDLAGEYDAVDKVWVVEWGVCMQSRGREMADAVLEITLFSLSRR